MASKKSIRSLLKQVHADKIRLHEASTEYKTELKEKLTSPWALGGAFVGGFLLSRFSRKKTVTNLPEQCPPQPSKFNFAGLISTLIVTILPKIILDIYQEKRGAHKSSE